PSRSSRKTPASASEGEPMRVITITTIISLVSLLVVACADEGDSLTGGLRSGNHSSGGSADPNDPNGGGAGGSTPGADPTQPGTCKEGVPHVGFANQNFVEDRKPGAIGEDR